MSSSAPTVPASVTEKELAKPPTNQPAVPETESWQSPNQPSWDSAKLALHIISTIIALPLLGISLAGFAAPLGFSSFPIVATPLAFGVLVYDIAEFIVTCVRKRKSGIRPKVSLGFELILSLGGFAISGLLVYFTLDSWRYRTYYLGNGNGIWPPPPVSGYVSNGYFWIQMSISACALAIALSLIHFVLSIRDCVEVDRQRMASKRISKAKSTTGPANSQGPVSHIQGPSETTIGVGNYSNDHKPQSALHGDVVEQKALLPECYYKGARATENKAAFEP